MHTTSRLLAVAALALTACSHSAIVPVRVPVPVAVTAPTPAQTPTLASAVTLAVHRGQMLAWLQAYTDAGVYPTNAQGWPASVFRDAKGVRCPMAELIFRSGHSELVDIVASTNNTLRLADVHDGPLAAWMADSGLTRDEIVMIQGAANIPMVNLELGAMTETADAHGRVHGRLDTALVALVDHTRESLVAAMAAATQKLDRRAPVVPAKAIATN